MPSLDANQICENGDTSNDYLSFGNDLKAKLHSPLASNDVSSPSLLHRNGYQHTDNYGGCNNSPDYSEKVCLSYIIWYASDKKTSGFCSARGQSPLFFARTPVRHIDSNIPILLHVKWMAVLCFFLTHLEVLLHRYKICSLIFCSSHTNFNQL